MADYRPNTVIHNDKTPEMCIPLKKASNKQVGGNHYKDFQIQPGYFSQINKLGFLEGCIVKRMCRHDKAGQGQKDLIKAIHEIELILEYEYQTSPQEYKERMKAI